MRIELITETRVGITREVLDVFAQMDWLLRGIEVVWHHIYLDVPNLKPAGLAAITDRLLQVPGVWSVREIDLLPGERRRMHFDTLLGALTDPVLALDAGNRILASNDAALEALRLPRASLGELPRLEAVVTPDIARAIRERREDGSSREVNIGGRPYRVDLLSTPPVVEDDPGGPHGAVLLFRPPSSLGEDLYALSRHEGDEGARLVGHSSGLKKVKELIRRFGTVNAPLLITGETGTGKELVAHECHRASDRADKPFLALNCAALPENLIESELFGYAAGAFSGAQKNGKPGLFELADRGTVFLDEVGEMSPYLQAKLLRVLQDGSFMRVGGRAETRVNVRILAATHRDLPAMVQEGSFREDLYYRLNVLTIHIPPLRERRDDIPLLADHFARRAAAQIGRTFAGISTTAAAMLREADWPGNARQLENVLFRAVTLAETDVLQPGDLGDARAGQSKGTNEALGIADTSNHGEPETLAEAVEHAERSLLSRLYAEHPSTRKLATKLGISHTAVANKLRKYGIQ
ncbi:sigma 54-interacting transcriptional regulator [Nitratireductor sp.]|uniref:sigma 54-interacting transcriptional regulator n=1 Tax=Nitratireductor sp. TaxID=1872084 RepID=UPI0025E7AA1E|nr:sigma 54-interacting transcriptional regulator [Nitratireductor sp.]